MVLTRSSKPAGLKRCRPLKDAEGRRWLGCCVPPSGHIIFVSPTKARSGREAWNERGFRRLAAGVRFERSPASGSLLRTTACNGRMSWIRNPARGKAQGSCDPDRWRSRSNSSILHRAGTTCSWRENPEAAVNGRGWLAERRSPGAATPQGIAQTRRSSSTGSAES